MSSSLRSALAVLAIAAALSGLILAIWRSGPRTASVPVPPEAPVAEATAKAECGMDTIAGENMTHAAWNGSFSRDTCLAACRTWLCRPENTMRRYHSRCVFKGRPILACMPTVAEPGKELPPPRPGEQDPRCSP